MFTFLVASFKKHGGFVLVLSVLLLYFAFTSNAEQQRKLQIRNPALVELA